jgi:hypothetical protein
MRLFEEYIAESYFVVRFSVGRSSAVGAAISHAHRCARNAARLDRHPVLNTYDDGLIEF